MGYDKTDTLAINTIRTLAVSFVEILPMEGLDLLCCLSLYAQHQSSSITFNTQADTPLRWTPPSSPTLATPVRPWVWPRS